MERNHHIFIIKYTLQLLLRSFILKSSGYSYDAEGGRHSGDEHELYFENVGTGSDITLLCGCTVAQAGSGQRLWGHFLTLATILEFHGGEEECAGAEDANVKKP